MSWLLRGLAARGRRRAVVVGSVLVLAIVGIAVIAPWFSADPIARDLDGGLTALGAPLPPSSGALLGTDHLGRDVWARVVAGAGTSLWIAAVAMLIALVIGLAVGLCAGYAGGRIDHALMRLVDLALAFPVPLLAILLAALLRQSELASSSAPVIITLAVIGWTTMARVIRGKAMVLARSEMVVAARAIGASPARIVLRHLLPNVAGVVIVIAALGFAQNLMAEAVLSYLGLGPPASEPTWGRMLHEGRIYYRTSPHLVLAPGIAILVTIVSFHIFAEGLRRLLDPREPR